MTEAGVKATLYIYNVHMRIKNILQSRIQVAKIVRICSSMLLLSHIFKRK